MLADRQAFYIFKHTILWANIADYAKIMSYQLIARVVYGTLAYKRKALAWRTTDNNIDVPCPYSRHLPYISACYVFDVRANCFSVREVVFMDGRMYGINLHCRDDIETCLLKSKRQSATPGKKVDGNRPCI